MRLVILVFLSVFLSGCAGRFVASIDQLSPPNNLKPNQVEKINKSFEAVWNDLVRQMSGRFFVINNIDKESRIINASFYLDGDISEYVDCGESEARLTDANGASHVQRFSYARPSEMKVASWLDLAWGVGFVVRTTKPSMEGRFNVYVAPIDGTKQSEIRVSARYVLSIRMEHRITQPTESGVRGFGLKRVNTEIVSFSSGGRSNHEIECSSTGALEREIVKLAR